MIMSTESIEHWTLVSTVILAAATVLLAFYTGSLAKSTREASVRQLGVQTWLHLAARFDSGEIRRARGQLAEQLEDGYDSSKHDDITEQVIDVFEDIGTVLRLGLINEDLADSAFSFYATRWWEVLKPYIREERRRNKDDDEIFSDFEALAKKMHREGEELELRKFLRDEKGFLRGSP
jgi:hypothetical protein